jgi:MarR family transcriptional regulator, transcriptional regulator for hemolysin
VSNKSISAKVPLGKLSWLITRFYVGALGARLAHLPISRHFYVLTVIAEAGGALTQKELAEAVWTDKATMVRIIDYLCEHGMAERITDPNDRRAYRISATEDGKAAVEEIRTAFEDVNRAATEGLSQHEQDTAIPMLERMACNLSKLPHDKVFIKIDRR